MAKSLQRLKQLSKPDSFDDSKTAAEISNSESNSEDFEQFLETFISQMKRFLHGDQSGDWHNNPVSAFGNDASLYALLQSVSWKIVRNGQTRIVFSDFDHVVRNMKVEDGGTLTVENGGRLICLGD